MKILSGFILISTTIMLPSFTQAEIQLRKLPSDMIAIKDIKETIATQTITMLKTQGLDSTTLSPKQTVALQEKIDFLTKLITDRIIRQKKNTISSTTLNDYLKFQLIPFIKETLLTIPSPKIQQALNTHANKILKENKINFARLPQKMRAEIDEKKQQCFSELIQLMNNSNRDYITMQELECKFNQVLSSLIEHARYVMLSVGLQDIMQQINTLKTVTNTQPYVAPQNKVS